MKLSRAPKKGKVSSHKVIWWVTITIVGGKAQDSYKPDGATTYPPGSVTPSNGDVRVKPSKIPVGDELKIEYRLVDTKTFAFTKFSLAQTSADPTKPADPDGALNFPFSKRKIQNAKFSLLNERVSDGKWDLSFSVVSNGTIYDIDPEITNSEDKRK